MDDITPAVEPAAEISFDSPELLEAISKASETIETDEPAKAEEPETPEVPPIEPAKDDKPSGDLGDIDPKTLADLREGKIIPKYRLDEVSARAKQYEAFGTPEEIAQKLQELSNRSTFTQPKSEPTPEQLSKEDLEDREHLHKVYPELKKIPDVLKELSDLKAERETERKAAQEREAADWKAHENKGYEKIKSLAKEAGLDIDNQPLMRTLNSMIPQLLEENKDLHYKFAVERNVEVLKDIFDEYKSMFSGVQRKAAADLITAKKREGNLPKAPVKGGAPDAPPAAKKPTTLEEATRMSMAYLEAHGL